MFRILLAIVVGGIGTGVGYGLGWVGGFAISGTSGIMTSMCSAVDAGIEQKLFTAEQAEQIGTGIAQIMQQRGQATENIKAMLEIKPQQPSTACLQFRKGISQTIS
jgi:cobalamin biosynthesis protein CbiD